MIRTTIVNVVATASLNQKVGLLEIRKLPNVLHDSAIYGGLVAYVKTSTMNGKVSVFGSGKMISVGTTSKKDATDDLHQVKEMLIEAGLVHPTSLVVKTQNIVATVNFGKPIDLERVAEKLHGLYEPEQFAGAIVRIDDPYRATVLLFASGKAVIAGSKSSRQLDTIVGTLSMSL